MTYHHRYQRRGRRKGLALVAVLVFTVVILMLVTSMTKILTRDHRQARVAQNRLQALWLVESAVQRSVQSLKRSPEYSGETWVLPATVFGNHEAAKVVIRVEKGKEQPAKRHIRIEARYPDHPVSSVLEIREFEVTTSAES